MNRDALCVKCNQVFVVTFSGEEHEVVPQEELDNIKPNLEAIPGGPTDHEDDAEGEGNTISIDFSNESSEEASVESEDSEGLALESDAPEDEAVDLDIAGDDAEEESVDLDASDDGVDLDADSKQLTSLQTMRMLLILMLVTTKTLLT